MRVTAAAPGPRFDPPGRSTVARGVGGYRGSRANALVPGRRPDLATGCRRSWIPRIAVHGRTGRHRARPGGPAAHATAAPARCAHRAGLAGTRRPAGFVLNLPAFAQDGSFDLPAFTAAADTAVSALLYAAPLPGHSTLRMAGLAELLALLGIDYGAEAGRDVVAPLRPSCGAGREVPVPPSLFGCAGDPPAAWPAPPPATAVSGLAEAAQVAFQAAHSSAGSGLGTVATFAPPGPPEALLGIETGGIAPPFSPFCRMGRCRAPRAPP